MPEHTTTEAIPVAVTRLREHRRPAPGLFSLRSRVLLLLALAITAMLSMVAYLAYTARTTALAEANDRVEHEAERFANAQNNVMDSVQNLLTLLTKIHDYREFGPTPQCRQLLADILAREPHLANIMYAAPNGDGICNATPVERLINSADRPYFAKALASAGLVIDEALYSRSTGKWSLPFAIAVRDDAGRAQGVMIAALDLQWVAAEFAKIKLPADARVGLMDHKGNVLVRIPDPEQWVGRDGSQTELFQVLRAHGDAGTAEARGFDGVQRVYGFAPFAKTAAGTIHLWVGFARESVMYEAERRFAWSILVGLILTALAFGLIWIGGERLLVRPVSAMSDAARRLGEGDFGARTGLRYANHELGQLARSFDVMAERIESREAQVRASQIELENRAEALRASHAAALNIMEDAVEARNTAQANEAELRARTAQLDALNKELEAFSYSVSHDLRAPLRSIDGFSLALLEDYADKLDEEGRDDLRRVRAATQRMGLLIDDLLKLSRLTRVEMNTETVDLSALARKVAAELKAGDPARSVTFDFAPKAEGCGDKRLLAVVLENLMGNAWKFTGKRTSAHIEFGVREIDGEPAYFVRDDGAGFDMTHVANLFAPFQRLHSETDFPGTGIGLATVRRIVQRHGGRTWAEGEVGKGATFYFTLPATKSEVSG